MNLYDDYLKYYNQFRDKIFTFIYYRVYSDKEIAEDLTSEVFLKALKNFESFDASQSFQAWIYRIAKNHIINFYEKKKALPLEMAATKTVDYAAENNSKYEADLVMTEIKRMKDDYREVLLLKFVDELTNEEIANVLGKDNGTVRTRISRALSELRRTTKVYD